MKMKVINPNPRLRASPYYDATLASGATEVTTYNGMLLPVSYGDPEGEYWSLKKGVCMWDVGAQRQVQLKGRDAAKLTQILCTRDISGCQVGQGMYVALCNHDGVLINDPILLKLEEDFFRYSISDSNVLFWARAICAERGLVVDICEPDVSPMAIQGPKSEDVVASILGDWVRDIKFFWFQETQVGDIPILVSRSGWSKQSGFEFYLLDGSRGTDLWSIVKEAGGPWGIRPGAPNHPERVESGLFSNGADNDGQTNPFEVRMGKYVNFELPDEVIGMKALKRIHAEGIKRHQLGLILNSETPMNRNRRWMELYQGEAKVGDATTIVWSWGMKRNIGLALISTNVRPGEVVSVLIDGERFDASLVSLPFSAHKH